jgi:Ca2+-binding RTX toxin-like protein
MSFADRTHDGLVDYLHFDYFDTQKYWVLEFGANALGQNLLPGSFSDAQRATFASAGHPGLDIFGNGRGSNQVFGSFTVHTINVDYSGVTPVLLSFSASFEQHSENPSAPALTGNIVYDITASILETVIELSDEGRDAIRSSVSGVLPDNVENLILTGTGDLAGSGNNQDNIISGNSGSNVLDGTSGADIIAGGSGNDTYVIDNSGDQVMELSSSGIDLIQSAVTYSLMQAWHVENLTLTGANPINGFGNWLDNVITGNAAANLLEGDRGNDTISGGGGSDTLIGGLGDDVLLWDALDAGMRGGEGLDMLRMDSSGVSLDLTLIANTLITDIEIINITGSGNNTLTLTMADVLAISSTTDVLRVDGNSGDVVNAGSGWVSGGSQVIAAQSYNSYALSGATLLVDADITVNLL